MTNTYQIHGAGCNNCLKRISKAIMGLSHVKQVISIDFDSITISFDDRLEYIDINELNQGFNGRYWLTVVPHIINFELVLDPFFQKI
jgi:copper chaperone CopZ